MNNLWLTLHFAMLVFQIYLYDRNKRKVDRFKIYVEASTDFATLSANILDASTIPALEKHNNLIHAFYKKYLYRVDDATLTQLLNHLNNTAEVRLRELIKQHSVKTYPNDNEGDPNRVCGTYKNYEDLKRDTDPLGSYGTGYEKFNPKK